MRNLLFIMLLATTACVAEAPDVDVPNLGPDAGGDEPIDEGVYLHVDGLPPQTHWDTVPVYGQGPAKGTLSVQANRSNVSTEISADGSYCLDVPLEKGVLNQLDLVAIDADGARSQVQSFEVAQAGEAPIPGESLPARNVVLGGLPISGSTMEEEVGTFAAMTDGSLNSSVRMQNAVWLDDWFALRIPSTDQVEKVRVYSSHECKIGDYLVHTAASIAPSMDEPSLVEENVGPWTFRGHFRSAGEKVNVTDCSTDELVCQEYNFAPTTTAAVAIIFSDESCTNTFQLGEHQVHEVEAWSPKGVAPPTISAPSCQSGI